MRHVALEYDLAAALRPQLVVDLGAGDGASFFAFCQALVDHEIDGSCYAIDAWQESPEVHPEATFGAVSAYGRAHFPGISYFVRAPAAEARRHFDEGSIDLLRLDGTRPDVIAGADVEAWFRRVRPGGLILWHGAAADPALWSLVASRCRNAVFAEGRGGLGLARKEGPAPQEELLRLLFEEGEGPDLERFYKHVHEHLDFSRLLALATQPAREKGP
jgi:hypothetical protein